MSDQASEGGGGAQTEYLQFETEADFQRAADRLLAAPGRELRIFDPDLAALRLNAPQRIEQLRQFLAASRTRRIYIAVHDPGHLTRECPRMMALLARFVSGGAYPLLCAAWLRANALATTPIIK